jgi:hypothetical protein
MQTFSDKIRSFQPFKHKFLMKVEPGEPAPQENEASGLLNKIKSLLELYRNDELDSPYTIKKNVEMLV